MKYHHLSNNRFIELLSKEYPSIYEAFLQLGPIGFLKFVEVEDNFILNSFGDKTWYLSMIYNHIMEHEEELLLKLL